MKNNSIFQHLLLALLATTLSLVPALAQQNQKIIFPTPAGFSTSFASEVRPTADGGYLLTGEVAADITPAGNATNLPRVVKVNANLQTEWDNLYLQPQAGFGAYIHNIGAGWELQNGAFLISMTDDSTDIDLMRLAPNGNLLWTKALPDFTTGFKIIGLLPNEDILAVRAYFVQGSGWASSLVQLDANGEITYSKNVPSTDAIQLANGDVLFRRYSFQSQKYTLTRTDNLGNVIWESLPNSEFGAPWTAMPTDGFAMINYTATSDTVVKMYNGLGVLTPVTPQVPTQKGSITSFYSYPDGSFLISGRTVTQRGYMLRFRQDGSTVWSVESPTDNQVNQYDLNAFPTADGWAVAASDARYYPSPNFGLLRAQVNTGIYINTLTGKAAKDDNKDCAVNNGELGVYAAQVTASTANGTFAGSTFTNGAGNYTLLLPAGDFTITVRTVELFFDLCAATPNTVSFATGQSSAASLDLPLQSPELIHQITGTVILDENDNCTADAGELPVPNSKLVLSLGTGHINLNADATGHYAIFVPDGDYQITVLPYNFYYGICGSDTKAVSFNSVAPTSQAVDFVSFPKVDCSIMQTSISTSIMRTCTTAYVTANYLNAGTRTAENATLTVELDPALTFVNANVTPSSQVGNTLRFDLGNVPPTIGSYANQINITVNTDCNLPLGNQVCVRSEVTPQTLCNPDIPNWNGAIVSVSGECTANDSIAFKIKNIGSAANSQQLEFVVVEDQIVLKQGVFQLAAGDSLIVMVLPSLDTTVTIIADQEPGFPGATSVSYSVTNCMGMGSNPSGYGASPSPFSAQTCTIVRGSYDPNDKSASPVGYGEAHFIQAGTPLHYKIRFQNTGTDTAFLVVLRDTLSPHLDPASVRVEGASHPYEMRILGGNMLQFTFANILLPDSTTNLEASQGFVSYYVEQQKNLDKGTVINNRAGIYFDFNAPVMTNTTWHTIAGDLISVSIEAPIGATLPVKVWPNPSVSDVHFELPIPVQDGHFILIDHLGKRLSNQSFTGNTFRFEKGQLPSGVYFFNIIGDNGVAFSGKIVLE